MEGDASKYTHAVISFSVILHQFLRGKRLVFGERERERERERTGPTTVMGKDIRVKLQGL